MPGDILIDVGANVGHIGLLLSDIIRPEDIFAFEPTPITYARLVENWRRNCVTPGPNLFRFAIGSEDGEILIPETTHPNTMNAVVELNSESAVDSNTAPVPLCCLNSLRNRWEKRKIGLLKIDVEGYEEKVFAGATDVLRMDRPRLLMFESLYDRISPAISRILDDAAYQPFQLDESGYPDITQKDGQNILACPCEEASQIIG